MLESSRGITPLFGTPYLYTSFNYPAPPSQPARDRLTYTRKVMYQYLRGFPSFCLATTENPLPSVILIVLENYYEGRGDCVTMLHIKLLNTNYFSKSKLTILSVKRKSTFFMFISFYFYKKNCMQYLPFNNDLLNDGPWDD